VILRPDGHDLAWHARQKVIGSLDVDLCIEEVNPHEHRAAGAANRAGRAHL
jgi:hypothetical protein